MTALRPGQSPPPVSTPIRITCSSFPNVLPAYAEVSPARVRTRKVRPAIGTVAGPGRAAIAHCSRRTWQRGNDPSFRSTEDRPLTPLLAGSFPPPHVPFHRAPAGQVVLGVDQRVVPVGHGRQRRAAVVVPQLPQVLGEPRDLPGQGGH